MLASFNGDRVGATGNKRVLGSSSLLRGEDCKNIDYAGRDSGPSNFLKN